MRSHFRIHPTMIESSNVRFALMYPPYKCDTQSAQSPTRRVDPSLTKWLSAFDETEIEVGLHSTETAGGRLCIDFGLIQPSPETSLSMSLNFL